jgi:myo-inositol-1(or 4)-monophosphatase
MTSKINVESVIDIATHAADLVTGMQQAGLRNISTKKNEIDLVTEADVACEHFLRAELRSLEPGIGFWGEESNQQPSGDSFWVVDPIDGTVNYAHGLTYSAVNVALCRDGETQLGVTVQMPYRRIYWAVKGEGAFLREPAGGVLQLRVNTAATLRSSLLATGFPYHNGEAEDNNNAEFGYFSPRCLALRIFGAAALDIAQVAGGMLAAFWEGWLSPWDAAVGALLVREAGGRVTDYNGQPWQFFGPGLVASNGLIHDAVIEGIRTARSGLTERRLAA